MAGEEKKKNRKPKQEPGPQPLRQVNALRIWRKPRAQGAGRPPPRAAGPPRTRPAPRAAARGRRSPRGSRDSRRPSTEPSPGQPDLLLLEPPTATATLDCAPLSREGQKVPYSERCAAPTTQSPPAGAPQGAGPRGSVTRRSLTLGAVVNAVELPVRGQSLHRHHLGASLTRSPNQPGGLRRPHPAAVTARDFRPWSRPCSRGSAGLKAPAGRGGRWESESIAVAGGGCHGGGGLRGVRFSLGPPHCSLIVSCHTGTFDFALLSPGHF